MKCLAAILFVVSAVYGQNSQPPAIEHAPTPEQCMADAKLWREEIRQHWHNSGKVGDFATGIGRLPTTTLVVRRREMGKCMTVDETNSHEYHVISEEIDSVLTDRFMLYLEDTRQLDKYERWEAAQQAAADKKSPAQ